VQDWQGLDLRVVPYKDTGTSIIGGTDEVQTLLDDQIVKSQAMNMSPFVKPFQERSMKHEATLQTLQDMLDAWLQCQATWLYLEPIFSSDDIVKQMPEEGDKFVVVDTTWRDIMARTAGAPAVLSLGRDPETLQRLRECNALLDEIQKGLAAYLEKKRLSFPRCVSALSSFPIEVLFVFLCPPAKNVCFLCSRCSGTCDSDPGM
jgi:dynein heavy chain, axonemal